MSREAAVIHGFDLAVELGQIRREGDRFYFPSVTDLSEPEHCVEVIGAYVFCTCRGFIQHRKACKHAEKVREYMTATDERSLVAAGPSMMEVWRSPQDLERRLVDLAAERNIIANFVKEAMVKGEDYGIIPGNKLPSLYKAGAEKLTEMYGLFPKIIDKHEMSNDETGHCRYVIVVGLFDRASGAQVAECPGECSTRESKYMYRWEYADKLPEGFNTVGLKSRSGRSQRGNWTQYRVENDDLWSLWNTVLKMAFKRAFVGATHQATRSSGLFTLTEQALDEFALEGEYRFLDEDDDDPVEGNLNVDRETGEILETPKASSPAPKASESAPARQTGPSRTREATAATEGVGPRPAEPPSSPVTEEQISTIADWTAMIKDSTTGADKLKAVDATRREWFPEALDGSNRWSSTRLTSEQADAYVVLLKETHEGAAPPKQ